MARVAILNREQINNDFKTIFQRIEARGGTILNIFKILAHCRTIGPPFLQLGNAILRKGSLPPLLRELAILRVGVLAKADYEVTQHIPIGRRAGLTDVQIEALADWRDSPHFSDHERAVLQYTDEVARNIRASDQAFQSVREFLSEEQVVELTIVVGYYGMVSRVLESLQIELEDRKIKK